MYDSLQPPRGERTRNYSRAKTHSEPLWLIFTQSRYEKSVSNIGVEKRIVESTCLSVRRSGGSSSCSTARSWDSNAYATSSYGYTPHSPWQECLAGIADSKRKDRSGASSRAESIHHEQEAQRNCDSIRDTSSCAEQRPLQESNSTHGQNRSSM